jgi:uncharacterized cupin superfamily protein
MHEAKIERTESGLRPADDGWFILNLEDIAWDTVPGGGTWCAFEEAASEARNPVGVGVHVLPPGESSGFYHRENEQEGFFVLAGECTLIVEGEERAMGQWDYFHCPAGTAHMTVGAGEQGCAIFMLGSRSDDHAIEYPVDPVAARHGVSVEETTTSAREAYKNRPPIVVAPGPPWPFRS